jgi:putative transposase
VDAGRDAIGRDAINRVSTTDDAVAGRDAVNRVSTGGATGNKNPMLHQNLSTIMRWFKGRATFEARKIHADFAWQARFHDHIILDAGKHEKIRHYILNNPLLWDKDRFNPKNQ